MLKKQLAESQKELKAAEDAVQALECKYRVALASGAHVAEIEEEFSPAWHKVNMLRNRCAVLEELIAESGGTATTSQ